MQTSAKAFLFDKTFFAKESLFYIFSNRKEVCLMLKQTICTLAIFSIVTVIMPISVSASRLPRFELPQRELPRHELPEFRVPELTPLETPELSVNFDERVNNLEGRGLGRSFSLPETQSVERPQLTEYQQDSLIPRNRVIPAPNMSLFGRIRGFVLGGLSALTQRRTFEPGHNLAAREAQEREELEIKRNQNNNFIDNIPNIEGTETIREGVGAAGRRVDGKEVVVNSNAMHSVGNLVEEWVGGSTRMINPARRER